MLDELSDGAQTSRIGSQEEGEKRMCEHVRTTGRVRKTTRKQ